MMSQISEIPASAYTREMETLGALPDISTFDGEPVPMSRNPLTPGTWPLPAGVVLGDVPFPPDMEVVLDLGLGLGSGIVIPADLLQAPPLVQLDPEHTTHVPAQRFPEFCQRFGFA
ncbi:hypothetical protein JCGZ_18109 [Jatropha curcas]|uniref:Uncharacterized protein n=1 Tax=Jatropha curcas TaxID=180498 RepID=A0A067K534_JATCU|nr:hypothetical protein JCGZ_18109 [Jatropha curcas]